MAFQIKLISVTLGILIFAQGLSFLLSLSSFEKIYSASLISTYKVAGNFVQKNIEASLRLGKPLSGLGRKEKKTIQRALDLAPGVSRIRVVSPVGLVYYSNDQEAVGTTLPYVPSVSVPERGDRAATEQIGESYESFFPLHGRGGIVVGYVNLEFPRQLVFDKLATMAAENLRVLAVITGLAILVLILAMSRFVARPLRKGLAAMNRLLEDPCANTRAEAGHASQDEREHVRGEGRYRRIGAEETEETTERIETQVFLGRTDELARLHSSLSGFASVYCARLKDKALLETQRIELLGSCRRLETLERSLSVEAALGPEVPSSLLEGQKEVQTALYELCSGVEASCSAREPAARDSDP